MPSRHSKRTHSSSISDNKGRLPSSFDIVSILSNLGIKYSIYNSKEDFDSTSIYGVKDLKSASSEDLSFCSFDDAEKAIMGISKSNARVIICHQSLEGLVYPRSGKQQCLIFVKNPRMVVMKIINEIYYSPSVNKKKRNRQNEEILIVSPTATLSKSARIGKNCTIGNFTKIGDKCIIGDNTVVGDRVIIEQNTRIGKNCIIQPGTVIGADGFAYERLEDTLELQRFPHIGGVVISNNVEICSNCSIARGSLSDTIIGEGTKIDALVHIAHNVEIGRHCALTAGTIIGGSTRIGDMCWTGLNSTIKHKVKIGNKVIIGSGASVINNIDDEDIVAGVPAKSIKHKVRSNQLFLMAGHRSHTSNGLKRDTDNNNTISIEK
ncbi:MAG: UDP-3-O-(3-hydroxymyristoyl)glucosamine N-acyltransferase [Nitrososphaeraceae archaeon]|nr:UDP-3-O-(3-hydroxymyristoyl)glucosamine N-acyltransferase [Nitrososphaeraceae archaeon]